LNENVKGQQNLTGFVELFSLVSADDLCSHASYQRCGKVLSTWVKLPYASEKR